MNATEDNDYEFEPTWPRGGGPAAAAERDEGKLREVWWAFRYHAGIAFVGTPIHFLAAVRDGIQVFRREFGHTFSQRWTHAEREEAYRRFINIR